MYTKLMQNSLEYKNFDGFYLKRLHYQIICLLYIVIFYSALIRIRIKAGQGQYDRGSDPSPGVLVAPRTSLGFIQRSKF